MADADFTHNLDFTGAAFGGGNYTWTGNYNEFGPFALKVTVFDSDSSENLSSADYFGSPLIPYAGFTVTINGQEYGVFQAQTPGNYVIPHNGELNGLSLTSPLNATANLAANVANCFAQGTRILTPNGETAIETLEIGEYVTTADGRHVEIIWIGRQTLVKRFAAERAQLVRISAQALGNHSDLYVTGDHGLSVHAHIINASALVNGSTIDWVSLADTPERQTVYHIETQRHDLIVANGIAAETYLDIPDRAAFDNFQEYQSLYGSEQRIEEMEIPRISSRRLMPQKIKAALGIGGAQPKSDVSI